MVGLEPSNPQPQTKTCKNLRQEEEKLFELVDLVFGGGKKDATLMIAECYGEADHLQK